MEGAIELSDLIWELRSELTRAMFGGEGKDIRFVAESVELELTMVVEKQRDTATKAQFWVLEGGFSAAQKSGTTQLLRLKLRPVLGDKSDEPAVIAGLAIPNER
ncbi:trypco2 family protein [Streptomyces sp. NPDC048508]|uniref:trypco2 family protein n=1 Tax=Streptomyces sp. NPDC048508 TaxID=3365561 RepID=UPI0037159881